MVNKVVDIKMRKDKGYYDIEFVDGDIATVDGFDTAIQMSLLCERRASESQIERPENRRGWFGNEDSNVQGFEQGSKLWLLEQARATVENKNRAVGFARAGLDWLVANSDLDGQTVTSELIADRIILYITLFKHDDKVFYSAFDLWENTFLDGEI